MDGFDLGQILALLRPLLLPVLLYVGKWLKSMSWFSNGLIPYAVLVLNGAALVLTQMGAVVRGPDGTLTPAPVEDTLGSLLGQPIAYAGVHLAFIGGLAAMVIGTVVQAGVEQFVVNSAHKGIKYRRMWKKAEAQGVIPADQATRFRITSPW